MKFKILLLLIPFLIVPVFCTNLQNDNFSKSDDYPFILEKEFGADPFHFLPIDIDKDGKDEFFEIAERKDSSYTLRLYRDPSAFTIKEWRITEGIITNPPFTFGDNNGEIFILVPIRIKNKAYLTVCKTNVDTLINHEITSGVDSDNNGFWDGHVTPRAAVDLNGDGAKDILLIVFTPHDLHPRGVIAYDLKNSTELWNFEAGAYINNILTADINEDGLIEIILGSSAVNNGSNKKGTNDSRSYLIVLDHNGIEITKKQWDKFTNCDIAVLDIDGDKKLEIISLVTYKDFDDIKKGRLTLWEGLAENSEKETRMSLHNPRLAVGDINQDGKEELIVSNDIDNKITVLGEFFDEILESHINIFPGNIIVEDINGDGKVEIIISGNKGTIVYDNQMKPLAQSNMGMHAHIAKRGYDESDYLVLTDGIERYAFLMKPNISHYTIRYSWLLLGFVFGMIVFWLIGYLFLKSKTQKSYLKFYKEILETFPFTTFLTNHKGNVLKLTNFNDTYFKIRQDEIRGSNCLEILEDEIKEHVEKLIVKIHKKELRGNETARSELHSLNNEKILISVCPILKKNGKLEGYFIWFQDVTRQKEMERAFEWAAVSQRLSHELKNPLHTVLLTLQRLQMAYQADKAKNRHKYDEYSDSIIEEVERLRKITDGFMKFTKQKPPDFEIFSSARLIKVIEKKAAEWLPEYLEFKVDAENRLPEIYVDIEQMQQVFINVFDNAVKAMRGRGRLNFRATTEQVIDSNSENNHNEFVVFEISDTGDGIPESEIAKLFDPYMSIRQGGTGLGLTICKKILEDHNGSISIQSKMGVGTTVVISLPVFHPKWMEKTKNEKK